jgi:hypothetical protein
VIVDVAVVVVVVVAVDLDGDGDVEVDATVDSTAHMPTARRTSGTAGCSKASSPCS